VPNPPSTAREGAHRSDPSPTNRLLSRTSSSSHALFVRRPPHTKWLAAIPLVAALCAGLAGAPAQAATPLEIPVVTLVAQPQDFGGFGPARLETYATAYALEWALDYEQSAALAEHEAAELNARGFQEGVKRHFSGRQEGSHQQRDAVSSAIVFATVAGAQQEFATTVAFDLHRLSRAGVHQFSVRSIPGSIGMGERRRNDAGDNVTFSTGRCYFSIGDGRSKGSAARQVKHSATIAAIAVYRRAKQACG
jgi:hypothetical protein